jgi:hypothetical protein
MQRREFEICVYSVGLQCKKNSGEIPSGTKDSGFSDIRFCETFLKPGSCSGSETVRNTTEAEKRRIELGIS